MTDLLGWALDGLLAAMLLWVGWRVLSSTDLFKGIVFFIAFGLIMALAWVRLGAVDVALAEAAIGAGLTGALLLAALSRLRRGADRARAMTTMADIEPGATRRTPIGPRVAVAGLSVMLFAGLGLAFLSLPADAPGLGARVTADLALSGVDNPVTAVLLNFRAYDTLLEMGVLFLAVVAAWSLAPAPKDAYAAPGSILNALVGLLVPPIVIVASYLLWIGAYAPGGAFQAGAVLAAGAVLVLLSGREISPSWLGGPLRAILSLGLGTFIAVGMASMITEHRFLAYPPDWAGELILLIEAAAALSIAATLAALFLGGRPRQDAPDDAHGETRGSGRE